MSFLQKSHPTMLPASTVMQTLPLFYRGKKCKSIFFFVLNKLTVR